MTIFFCVYKTQIHRHPTDTATLQGSKWSHVHLVISQYLINNFIMVSLTSMPKFKWKRHRKRFLSSLHII